MGSRGCCQDRRANGPDLFEVPRCLLPEDHFQSHEKHKTAKEPPQEDGGEESCHLGPQEAANKEADADQPCDLQIDESCSIVGLGGQQSYGRNKQGQGCALCQMLIHAEEEHKDGDNHDAPADTE